MKNENFLGMLHFPGELFFYSKPVKNYAIIFLI